MEPTEGQIVSFKVYQGSNNSAKYSINNGIMKGQVVEVTPGYFRMAEYVDVKSAIETHTVKVYKPYPEFL